MLLRPARVHRDVPLRAGPGGGLPASRRPGRAGEEVVARARPADALATRRLERLDVSGWRARWRPSSTSLDPDVIVVGGGLSRISTASTIACRRCGEPGCSPIASTRGLRAGASRRRQRRARAPALAVARRAGADSLTARATFERMPASVDPPRGHARRGHRDAVRILRRKPAQPGIGARRHAQDERTRPRDRRRRRTTSARAERVLRAAGRPAARGLPVRARRREDGRAARLLQDPNVELQEYFLKGARATGRPPAGRARRAITQRRYLEAIDQYDIVFGVGPAGTGKTYLAMAQAVVVSAGEARDAHHPRAARGRSRREARLPAGRPAGKGQSVPAAALRRALRHARRRARRAAARARRDRSGADRVHARPHAERRVRDPRRSAEHDVRADEDVPDAARLRIEGRRHRRRHADRPAAGPRCPAWSRR